MRVPALSALTIFTLLLAGCTNGGDSPTLILTPDLEATVSAAGELHTVTPIPTPDIDATVEARVAEALSAETPAPTPDTDETVEAQPTATVTPTPFPTPTLTPVPTPTPTSTPTPSPTPTPEPSLYEFESVDSFAVAAGDGLVSTEFTLVVRNIGGTGGEESVPVRIQVDGGEYEDTHTLQRPDAGEQVSFTVVQELEPGEHNVLFEIGGTEKSVDVNVVTADLVVHSMVWSIVEDGSIALTSAVTNNGQLTAEGVKVWVNWDSVEASASDVANGQVGPITVEKIGAGETEIVVIPIEVTAGAYSLTLSVETESVEIRLENNSAQELVEVDYVQLRPVLAHMELLGYDREGYGLIRVLVQVNNEGQGESGTLKVGLACGDGCLEEVQIGSIAPGQSEGAALEVTVPQGETAATIYAGSMDDGYRWGSDNTINAVLQVPEKLPVLLEAQASADVTGYWLDGTAEVSLSVELRNDGYLSALDSYSLEVACRKDEVVVEDCSSQGIVELTDGFGPGEAAISLSAPMGSVLEIDLDAEGVEVLELEIPERILGVDRDVWNCYSNRPGPGIDGCGGWQANTVYKWNHDVPVRVWASGREDYIGVFETVLDELAPLLNLEFVWVDTREEATLEAQLGVPQDTAFDVEWQECADYGGCANTQINDVGNVKSGFIVVWDFGEPREWARGAMIHELLHVVSYVGHRHTLDTLMGEGGRLSLYDEALLGLHHDPLIKPGMTMEEVEELVVLEDELLDSSPDSEHEEVRATIDRAADVLLEAGSVRFELVGTGGYGCKYKLTPTVYEVGDFRARWEHLVHLRDAFDRFMIFADGETWRELNGVWTGVEHSTVYDLLGWSSHWTSPLGALWTVLAASSDDNVRLVGRIEGQITVEASWLREGHSRLVMLTVDEETHHIVRYTMTIQPWLGHDNQCARVFTATKAEYGIEIEVPHALAAAREG